LFALSGLVNENVVVMFFPAMRELAFHHFLTPALKVEIQILEFLPVLTVVGLVFKFAITDDFSAEVLLVVSIHAMQSVMRGVPRTHYGFVVEHKKRGVLHFMVQQIDPELLLIMNEGTKGSVNALFWVLIARTIARFESVVVVHLFHDVVRLATIFWAVFEIAFFT